MKDAKARPAKPQDRRRSFSTLRRGVTRSEVAHDGSAFPIVGIGASAGGLDAFKKFFGALPSNSGLATRIRVYVPTSSAVRLSQVGSRCWISGTCSRE